MLRIIAKSRDYPPILFCLGLGSLLLYVSLLRVLPSAVFHGVGAAYSLSIQSYGYMCASYYFFSIPLQLVVGVLVDRYYLPRLLMAAMIVCAVGAFLYGNVHSLWWAEVGRMLIGVGASSISVSALKLLSLRLLGYRFAFYLGLVLGVGMLGGFVMDMLLLMLVQDWGWRLTCYLFALIGLFFVLQNIMIFSRRWHFDASKRDAPVPLSLELRELQRLLVNRRLWVQCLLGALLYFPIAGFAESWGVRFLHHNNLFSHAAASVAMSFIFLGFAVGAPVLGWMYARYRQYQLILTGSAVSITILLSIVLFVPDLSAFYMGVFLFVLGFFSSSLVVIFGLNAELATRNNAGKLFAVTQFIIMLAGGSAWLIGWLYQVIKKYHYTQDWFLYPVSSYQLALLVLPLGALLAVFLTYYVREHGD